MEITTDQLLTILGAKEVEIFLLKQQVAARDEALKALAPKPEPEAPQ